MQVLEHFIKTLTKLPGVGPKSAVRMALHLLKTPQPYLESLSQQLAQLKYTIHPCKLCRNYTDQELCSICVDETRDKSVLCVLEGVTSLFALEKAREFQGLYFILHGHLDPSEGVGAQELAIPELLKRIEREPIQELILANGFSLEGEITASYIAQEVSSLVKVTRLAIGLPMGSELEYVDRVTLAKALSHRVEF